MMLKIKMYGHVVVEYLFLQLYNNYATSLRLCKHGKVIFCNKNSLQETHQKKCAVVCNKLQRILNLQLIKTLISFVSLHLFK